MISSGGDKYLCRELAKRLEPEAEEGEVMDTGQFIQTIDSITMSHSTGSQGGDGSHGGRRVCDQLRAARQAERRGDGAGEVVEEELDVGGNNSCW